MTSSRAFTLVETMVAIAILAVALVGPFIAVQNALRASYIARDQLIASQLAQEGMEYLRFIRDNNYLNSRDWLDGFTDATRNLCFSATETSPSGHCTLDPKLGDFHQTSAAMVEHASVAAAPSLALDAQRVYTQSAGSETPFKRTVQIVTLSDTEIRATVTVSWVTVGQTYSVVVVDILQDWL